MVSTLMKWLGRVLRPQFAQYLGSPEYVKMRDGIIERHVRAVPLTDEPRLPHAATLYLLTLYSDGPYLAEKRSEGWYLVDLTGWSLKVDDDEMVISAIPAEGKWIKAELHE